MIFYTHGICDKPGTWDSTPEDFRWVLEQCQKAEGEILAIPQACERVLV